jgi:transcriptional regulator with XRE-family HTH domain
MNEPQSVLLEQMRAARWMRGLSKADVARFLNLSRQQYTALENGHSTISLVHLERLARVLGVCFVIGSAEPPVARGGATP